MGATVILHSRHRWSTAQRAAACGAVLASVVLPWWLASGAGSSRAPGVETAPPSSVMTVGAPPPMSTSAPPARPVATLPKAATDDSAAVPYRYVGQWKEGPRTGVVLSRRGISVVVRVPGAVDDRYEAESVDERQVLLRDRWSGRAVALPLTGDAARVVAPSVGPQPSTGAMTHTTSPAPTLVTPTSSPPDSEPEN